MIMNIASIKLVTPRPLSLARQSLYPSVISVLFYSSSKSVQKKKFKNDHLFTQSPFQRSTNIHINEQFTIHRELKDENDPYGVRRYYLLPRMETLKLTDEIKSSIIASLNADTNIVFGARLHLTSKPSSSTPDNILISEFMTACGPLLDVAKEDAAMNGQQPQALATLNGLSSWVRDCLNDNGRGSQVLTTLLHEKECSSQLHTNHTQNEIITVENKQEMVDEGCRKNQPINRYSNQIIRNRLVDYTREKEEDRKLTLDAVRAIATGIPRPGYAVVGAGTYRDGKDAWISLAWEYCQLVPASNDDLTRKGLMEVMLYKSRNGEVASIEHLGHTEPDYLKEAGGAMARLFFL